MFGLKCLPGILIGEGNVGVQQQEKYILKIGGGGLAMSRTCKEKFLSVL